MTVACKVGTFAIDSTKTVGQDQSVTGVSLGVAGKVAIFWWSGTTSATDATAGGHIRGGIGFAASATERGWVLVWSEDALGSSDAHHGINNTACIAIAAAGAAIDGRADFKSWDGTDGNFTITIADQFTANYIISYMIIGGTDLTNVKVGSGQAPTTAIAKAFTGVGFQGTFGMFAATRRAGFSDTLSPTSDGQFSLGFATGSAAGSEYTLATSTRDNQNTQDTIRYLFDNGVISLVGGTGDIAERAEFTSWDTDGFTITWLEKGAAGAYAFIYLIMKGPTFTVGDLLTQTDTTTTVVETTTSTPRGIFMMSHNTAKSTSDTPQAHQSVSLGAASSTTARCAQGFWSEDGTADSEGAVSIEYDGIYTRIAADDTLVGVGDISAIDSTSFTFIMDDADPDQAFAAWWCIQDAPIEDIIYHQEDILVAEELADPVEMGFVSWLMPDDIFPIEEMPTLALAQIDENYDVEYGHDYDGSTIWQAPENVEDFQASPETTQIDESYDVEYGYDYSGVIIWQTPENIDDFQPLPEILLVDESWDYEYDDYGFAVSPLAENFIDLQGYAEIPAVDEQYNDFVDLVNYAGWANWVIPFDVVEPLSSNELAQIDEHYEQPYEPVNYFGWQAWVTPDSVEDPQPFPVLPIIDHVYDVTYEFDGWQVFQDPGDVVVVLHPDPDDAKVVAWRDRRGNVLWQDTRASVHWRDKRETNE